jgi:transcriptional regulator with XRE-family HTH domain
MSAKSPLLITFSRNLKFLRSKRKVSRSQMVGYLRIKYSRYGPYEEARAFPSTEILVDICNALDYYDIYRMLTVDLKKDKAICRSKPPANVSAALKEIIEKANGILSPPA